MANFFIHPKHYIHRMFTISDNFKTWFETAKLVIKTPRTFFREMPASGSLKEGMGLAFFTLLIISLLYAPLIFLLFFHIPSENYIFFIISESFKLFLSFFYLMSILILVNAVMSHILLLIFGSKGKLTATLQVFSYYVFVSLALFPIVTILVLVFIIVGFVGIKIYLINILSWVLLLIFLTAVGYSFYILFVGLSEVHNISMKRVLIALLSIPVGMTIIFTGMGMVLMFITGFSSPIVSDPVYPEEYTYIVNEQPKISLPVQTIIKASFPVFFTNYINSTGYVQKIPEDHQFNKNNQNQTPHSVHPKITAPYGSKPVVDGRYTSEDKWYETQETSFISGNTAYSMAAKHDGENLYLLVKWEDKPDKQDYISISFEQDGDSHDHNLKTGRNDRKSTWASVYGANNFEDSFNQELIMVTTKVMAIDKLEDGMLRSNNSDGFWVHEWVVPLRSGDVADIYVQHFPTTLGFSMTTNFFPEVTWPPIMGDSNLETWGDIEILGSHELIYSPEITNLIASSGTPPVTDGFYKPEDGWDETQQIDFISRGVDFTIAAKHDNEKLYLLIKWESEPEWEGVLMEQFEQDGDSHDHNMKTGRYISMRALVDLNSVGDPLLGSYEMNYSGGIRVYEFVLPFKNQNPENLNYFYIDQIPSTLGYTFLLQWKNEGTDSWRAGSWPVSSAGPYRPETWGNIVIVP